MKYRQKINGQWSNWINFNIKALDGMPIGSIIMFAGETIPTGWLICDGDTLNEEEYPELYDIIGHTYGGSGLDFNLPDFRGRAGFGHDDMTTGFYPMGNTGGEKAHTLTLNEMPSHQHKTQAEGSATGLYKNWGTKTAWGVAPEYLEGTGGETYTNLIGGNGAHNNMPPYIVVNYIIKATNTTPTMASVVNAKNSSTEDTYSCKYINDKNTYSSSETLTDKTWVNGKPIYRKVLVVNKSNWNNTSHYYEIPNGVSNLEFYVSLEGWAVRSGGVFNKIPNGFGTAGNNGWTVTINDITATTIGVQFGSSTYDALQTNNCVVIIFEYTKTTD